jgi:poly(A)-specific ribonuclease
MNVSALNFENVVDELCKVIEHSDFIAVDCEMTGLITTSDSAQSPADTFQTRYAGVRDSAENFMLLQYGITAFTFDKESMVYNAKPYNVYLFPRPASVGSFIERDDHRFLCQASSISFLCDQGFDFNTCFRHGVTYQSMEIEKRKEKAATGKIKNDGEQGLARSKIIINRVEDQEFVDLCVGMVREAQFNSCQSEEHSTAFVILPGANAFRRRLLYDAMEEKEFETVLLQKLDEDNKESNGGSACLRAIIYPSTEERKTALSLQNRADVEKTKKAIKMNSGFRKVIDSISSSRKCVVGHNCLLDLAQTYSKFVGTLPAEFTQFVEKLHTYLPIIVDTKYLVSTNPTLREHFSSSSLGDVYASVEGHEGAYQGFCEQFPNRPNVKLSLGFERYLSNKFRHEAGYDSFMTGVVFLKCMSAIGVHPSEIAGLPNKPRADMPSFLNRLYLMRMGGLYIDLCGQNIEPDRSKWLHVTGFPSNTKTNHVVMIMKKYGGKRFFWLDECNLFIEFESTKYFTQLVDASDAGSPSKSSMTTSSGEEPVKLETLRLQLFSDFVRQRKEDLRQKKKHFRALSTVGIKRKRSAEHGLLGEEKTRSGSTCILM